MLWIKSSFGACYLKSTSDSCCRHPNLVSVHVIWSRHLTLVWPLFSMSGQPCKQHWPIPAHASDQAEAVTNAEYFFFMTSAQYFDTLSTRAQSSDSVQLEARTTMSEIIVIINNNIHFTKNNTSKVHDKAQFGVRIMQIIVIDLSITIDSWLKLSTLPKLITT